MSAPAVVMDDVTKRFARGEYHDTLRDLLGRLVTLGRRGPRREWFNAVDHVSFEVHRGEALGIIGPNGSGKSTVLKLLTGIYVPTSGDISVLGRSAPLIEVGAGFHPDLTGRENIFLNGAITGMSRAEIASRFDEIVEFSGLEDFLDTPVKRYSSGMYMRLGFSIAAHIPAENLIVDEVLAVGDVGFRTRCIERMHELKENEGRTVLFVSHNSSQVRSLCDRVIYLQEGRKVFDGDAVEGTRRYENDILAGRVGLGAKPDSREVTAPAVLEEVRLLGADGDASTRIQTGQDVEVLVRYRVREVRDEPPVLSVALQRPDGVRACVLNSRERGIRLPGEDGVHGVRVRFRALPLYPVRHTLEVSLWDARNIVPLDQASAGVVEVEEGARHTHKFPGVFYPEGELEIVRKDPASP